MCTVSYIPIGKKELILTSSRDEGIERKPSTGPWENKVEDLKYLAPRDEEAGGSWISATENGRVYCLLNGAFEAHHKMNFYRKSRGTVFLELLKEPSIISFNKNYNLVDIEPFTIVAIEGIYSRKKRLIEFRWDGVKKYLKNLDPKESFIWSSSPLYDKEIRSMRTEWFTEWQLEHPNPCSYDVYKFHRFGGKGDLENNFYMHRGNVRTVSITQIQCKTWGIHMNHRNLISYEETHRNLKPKKKNLNPEANSLEYY